MTTTDKPAYRTFRVRSSDRRVMFHLFELTRSGWRSQGWFHWRGNPAYRWEPRKYA